MCVIQHVYLTKTNSVGGVDFYKFEVLFVGTTFKLQDNIQEHVYSTKTNSVGGVDFYKFEVLFVSTTFKLQDNIQATETVCATQHVYTTKP